MSGHPNGNRKVLKFKRTYTITVVGSVDTQHPEEEPWMLKVADNLLKEVTRNLDEHQKSVSATLKSV